MTDEDIIRANLMSDNAARALDRLTAEMARKDAAIEEALDKLDKLARLGNEPYYGNSVGNEIARAAYNTIRAALAPMEKKNG